MIELKGYFDTLDSPEFDKEFESFRMEHNHRWFDTMEVSESEWTVETLYEGSPEHAFIYRITKKS